MLGYGQKIIYIKNGKVISEVDKELSMPLATAHHIRGSQPFVSEGGELTIPFKDRREWRTTEVLDVERKRDTLTCYTLNSTYEIKYVNIDLEKILEDGEDKGVNKFADGISPPEFPYKQWKLRRYENGWR